MEYKCTKIIDGSTYDTFQETCYFLWLLDYDKEFIDGIIESSDLGSGYQLCMGLTWQLLSYEIIYERRNQLQIKGYFFSFFLIMELH